MRYKLPFVLGCIAALPTYTIAHNLRAAQASLTHLEQQLDQRRILDDAEKTVVGEAITAGLEDPGAAQFNWPPLLLTQMTQSSEGTTLYCPMIKFNGNVAFRPVLVSVVTSQERKITHAKVSGVGSPEKLGDFVTLVCGAVGYLRIN